MTSRVTEGTADMMDRAACEHAVYGSNLMTLTFPHQYTRVIVVQKRGGSRLPLARAPHALVVCLTIRME